MHEMYVFKQRQMQGLINSNVLRLLFATILLLGALPASRAEVTASITPETGEVDTPLQLQYQFINIGRPEAMPRSIMVEGLEIRLTNRSQRIDVAKTQTVTTAVYSYNVVPKRSGNFSIPSFLVSCTRTKPPNRQQVRTPTVSFRVGGPQGFVAPASVRPVPSSPSSLSATANAPTRLPRRADGEAEHYFGEIIGKTNSVVVGEVVHIALRYYFRADCQFDNLQRPTLLADRVINGPVGDPVQSEVYIEDAPYNAVIFQSFLVPVGPGRVSIKSTIEGKMIITGARPPAQPDPFFDQFFRDFPKADFGGETNIVATAAGEFLVRDLPPDSQPARFRGAVGQFTLEASAVPEQLKVGETATFSVTVSGHGNFLAVDAASLLDAATWKVQTVESSTGTNNIHADVKTFVIKAQALAPTENVTAVAIVFFDPLVEEYRTVASGRVSVVTADN